MTTKILLLPGMGDIYWVLTILRQFMAAEGITNPEIWIWDIDGRKRSKEFIEQIPWLAFGGYWARPTNAVFDTLYYQSSPWCFRDYEGFDFALSMNGLLRNGLSIEQTGYKPDWHCLPWTHERKTDDIVVCLSDFGMFRNWVKQWTVEGCTEFVKLLMPHGNVILTGSRWDQPFNHLLAKKAGAENRCGLTGISAFMQLLSDAKGCIGWCGGNTIVSAAIGVPTKILWCDYFTNRAFFKNAAAPTSTYAVVNDVKPSAVVEAFVDEMAG